MHKKALTVAIAGALAAPLAAQAVDFTISGHVNRALFVTDSDAGTKAAVANNTGSSTRVRANGSTELMNGNTVAIQFEYEEGGAYDKSRPGDTNDDDGKGGTGVKLRHANVQYGGAFGKVTLGQGSEAGDGSQYSDTTGVWGIGHGAGTGAGFSLGSYFGSLDAGGRENMVRYDSPADLGPVSAAVSVANGDRVSGRLKLSSEFSGTSFGAQLATLQMPRDESIIGASAGATMASGLTLSGAWAKGKEMGANLTDPSYFQVEIGYKFGNTGVAVSWYNSEDFVTEGSEGTAIGVGARHTLPKAGAELYAAAQNYDVEMTSGAESVDETVFMFGTRVKF